MSESKKLEVGKKIKLLLVKNDINQNQVAKFLGVSDSLFSDKLNGKVKITIDELYNILHYLNNELNIDVDANYFLPLLTPDEISNTN